MIGHVELEEVAVAAADVLARRVAHAVLTLVLRMCMVCFKSNGARHERQQPSAITSPPDKQSQPSNHAAKSNQTKPNQTHLVV